MIMSRNVTQFPSARLEDFCHDFNIPLFPSTYFLWFEKGATCCERHRIHPLSDHNSPKVPMRQRPRKIHSEDISEARCNNVLHNVDAGVQI
ncbi:hypothetical protein ACTXT7_014092 [Hymenolepis weldensis]